MTDIVEKLKDRRAIDGSVTFVEMSEQVLDDAIYEIERLRNTIAQLRAVSGAVSVEGHSYADIRRSVRTSDIDGSAIMDGMSFIAPEDSKS
jgi:hypothetical protein